MNKFLVEFKKYLQIKTHGASSAPPISIRAKDLDQNNLALTIIADKKSVYVPSYSKDGTSLQFKAQNKIASWQEIDVCIDGVAKKMSILASEPY